MILVSAQAFPPATGGIENLMHGLALHAARAGHPVQVLADGGRAARAHDRAVGMPYAVARFAGPRPLRRWLKARALLARARREPVSALFLDSWKSLEPLPAGLPFPAVVWAHGNEFPAAGPKVGRVARALAKADRILVNSRDTEARIGRATPGGVPRTLFHPPVFRPAEPTPAETAAAEALWQGEGPRLLTLCRLVDWKGVDTALRALPAIRARHPGLRHVIAGDGPDRARLESLARELGLAGCVHFAGWRQGGAKTALLRSADLMLQPGRRVDDEREGYGIAYVEAALEGLPVISGREGGAPEAVIDGVTGRVVDAGAGPAAPVTVAGAALALLADASALEAMRAAARAHGEASLWEHRIDTLLTTAGISP